MFCFSFSYRIGRSSTDYSCGINTSIVDASCEIKIPGLDYLYRAERSTHEYSCGIEISRLDCSYGMERSSFVYYDSYGIARSSPDYP